MTVYVQAIIKEEHQQFIAERIAPMFEDKEKILHLASLIKIYAPEYDMQKFLDVANRAWEAEKEFKELDLSPEEYTHHTSNINYRRS